VTSEAVALDPGSLLAEVDEAVQELGGYWPPSAAALRLAEEVAEVARSLTAGQPNRAELSDELSDVWIVLACLANQFHVRLPRPGGRTRPRADPMLDLMASVGDVSRAVNYYDGPKRPRTLDNWVPLRQSLDRTAELLADVARCYDVELGAAVRTKLSTSRRIDRGRFDTRSDPADSARRLSTAGIGIPDARVWVTPCWRDGRGDEANVHELRPLLLRFCRAAIAEGLQALVAPVTATEPPAVKELCESLGLTVEHDDAPDLVVRCPDNDLLLRIAAAPPSPVLLTSNSSAILFTYRPIP
jgi:NTP pyrophosphatase (non-canonical NTP hydrolase)